MTHTEYPPGYYEVQVYVTDEDETARLYRDYQFNEQPSGDTVVDIKDAVLGQFGQLFPLAGDSPLIFIDVVYVGGQYPPRRQHPYTPTAHEDGRKAL